MKANIDIKKEAKRVVFGLAGAIIMAVNIKTFVRAGGLYPGGFNGVTLLIQTVFQRFLGIALPFTLVNLLLNAVPTIVCFKAIGKKFTVSSAMIIVLTSILTDIIPSQPITQDILLIAVFGGLINGFAVSLCLMGGTSGGGTDFIAIYFAEKKNKDVWNFILLGNGCVLVIAGILFDGIRHFILLFSSLHPHRSFICCIRRIRRRRCLLLRIVRMQCTRRFMR